MLHRSQCAAHHFLMSPRSMSAELPVIVGPSCIEKLRVDASSDREL